MPAIAAIWVEKSRGEVEERHVVIPGDDEQRKRQAIEKLASLPELAAARPLCEVARHGDEIRRDRFDGPDERRDEPRIDAAEMNVGEMDDRSHRIRSAARRPAAPPDTCDT